ncbi:MAG: SIS domain-containing protein [Sphaerochaetaceae bacterium]
MAITFKEINLQYQALHKTYSYMESKKSEINNFYQKYNKLGFTFIGCGSGYNLCQSGEFIAQKELGKKACAVAGGDLMLNVEEYKKIYNDSILIIPTRSGSTSEIVYAVKQIKKNNKDIPIIVITCKENSILSNLADLVVEIPWAFDESVCQTRSVTNLYTVLLMLIAYFSNNDKRIIKLKQIIDNGDSYIESIKPGLEKIAKLDWENVIALADGEVQGLVSEGALAFTEISRKPGAFYHILDVRHGPMVLIRSKTLVLICLSKAPEKYTLDLIKDLISNQAKVIVYADESTKLPEGVLLQINSNLKINDGLCGIPFIGIAQLLSYYKAINDNVDPDKPDGLDAWIELDCQN